MQLSSSKPCVVILTEKEVEVSVNNHATFTLPKNYLAAFACNNNVIELSTLNHVLITHINRNIINDYLLFLNKNLTCVKPWSRLATPVIACH
ncbi:DNA-binding transcriptional regulator EnvY, partial [Escherichia coli]